MNNEDERFIDIERRYKQTRRPEDVRTESERDEARVIHSAAFRRLQSKTQVLGLGESDFYRTRLTHSMEVAQIGRGILQYLRKNQNFTNYTNYLPTTALITAICLAHDIGHPPFGHGGEVALNYCMREHGGFEGNGQTLRILGKLDKCTNNFGLNPTRRMLLGILKYPATYSNLVKPDAYKPNNDKDAPYWLFEAESQKPPKCYHDCDQDIVDFIFEGFEKSDVDKFTKYSHYKKKNDRDTRDPKTQHKLSHYKSLDCSIMNLADNISYSLHDFEDALSLGMINQAHWEKHFESKEHLFDELNDPELQFKFITKNLFSSASYERKESIGSLVNLMITSAIIENNSSKCTEPLLTLEVKLKPKIEELRKHIFDLVRTNVIEDENVQQLEFKGQKLIIELFQVLAKDPKRFLPKPTKDRWEQAGSDKKNKEKESAQLRVICDFVAGMTDDYATKFYEKLFSPSKGSIFDRL
jgi:dGTPase